MADTEPEYADDQPNVNPSTTSWNKVFNEGLPFPQDAYVAIHCGSDGGYYIYNAIDDKPRWVRREQW